MALVIRGKMKRWTFHTHTHRNGRRKTMAQVLGWCTYALVSAHFTACNTNGNFHLSGYHAFWLEPSPSPSLSLLYLIFFKSFPFAISSFEFIRHLKLLVRIHFKIWFIFFLLPCSSIFLHLLALRFSPSKMIDELWKELNPFSFVPALTPILSFWHWHYDAFSNARTICDL